MSEVAWWLLVLGAVAAVLWMAPSRRWERPGPAADRWRPTANEERAVVLFLVLTVGWAATSGVAAYRLNRAHADDFRLLEERGDGWDCFVDDADDRVCVDNDDRRGYLVSGFYAFVVLPALAILGIAALLRRRWAYDACLVAVWVLTPVAILSALLEPKSLWPINAASLVAILWLDRTASRRAVPCLS